MAMAQQAKFKLKLPPEGKLSNLLTLYSLFMTIFSVNRILYVRNLPYKITTEEIYDIFGKFGALRQVRLGINPDTKGTAYVVYEVCIEFQNEFEYKFCITDTAIFSLKTSNFLPVSTEFVKKLDTFLKIKN